MQAFFRFRYGVGALQMAQPLYSVRMFSHWGMMYAIRVPEAAGGIRSQR